jgi:hypothetical protein
MAESAMETSDPNIIKTFGTVAEKLESDKGFFGHGMIGGSGGADSDVEGGGESARRARRGKGKSAGGGVISSLGEKPTKRTGFGRFDTSDEDWLLFGVKSTSDGGDLKNGFTCAVNNFWGAEALLSLEIEFSKSTRQKSSRGAPARHKN